METILTEVHDQIKSTTTASQYSMIQDLRKLVESKAFKDINQETQDKQLIQLIEKRISIIVGEAIDDAINSVQERNAIIFKEICQGKIIIGAKQSVLSMSSNKAFFLDKSVSNSPSPSRIFIVQDEDEKMKKSILAKQLIRKKKQQKLQRHLRLQKILEKQTELIKAKQDEKAKQNQNIIYVRNQQSLQNYRITKQKYDGVKTELKQKIEQIKDFQKRINSKSLITDKMIELDNQRNKELETSRTQALLKRRQEFKTNYREVDEHNNRYMQQLKQIQSDRLSRMRHRKSQDVTATKKIKPFEQIYVPKDMTEQIKARTNKVKQFKQHVRLHLKPKIDPEKRRQIIHSIISEESARYRSLGIIKEQVNGRIIQKPLPKINLRSIGNQYMQHAKKLKSSLEHRSQIKQQQQPKQHGFTDYLKDLKIQERKRMSRSEQIEKSHLPIRQKPKKIQITIDCLENQIKNHQILVRNSAGLTQAKVQELKQAIDSKSLEMANLKIKLMELFNTDD